MAGDPVMVLHEGEWFAGELLAWRWTDKATERWRGFVTYSVGVGDKRLLWVDGEHVRRGRR